MNPSSQWLEWDFHVPNANTVETRGSVAQQMNRLLEQISWRGESNVTNFRQQFQQTFPTLISVPHFPFHQATDAYRAFYQCERLEFIGFDLVAPNCTIATQIFLQAQIKWIETVDMPLCTGINGLFQSMYKLIGIGSMNLPVATNGTSFYMDCYDLRYAVPWDTSALTTMEAFHQTTALLDIFHLTTLHLVSKRETCVRVHYHYSNHHN